MQANSRLSRVHVSSHAGGAGQPPGQPETAAQDSTGGRAVDPQSSKKRPHSQLEPTAPRLPSQAQGVNVQLRVDFLKTLAAKMAGRDVYVKKYVADDDDAV